MQKTSIGYSGVKSVILKSTDGNIAIVVGNYYFLIKKTIENTLLLKFFKIEEIGCKMLVGGTALLSFLYHVSKTITSIP